MLRLFRKCVVGFVRTQKRPVQAALPLVSIKQNLSKLKVFGVCAFYARTSAKDAVSHFQRRAIVITRIDHMPHGYATTNPNMFPSQ